MEPKNAEGLEIWMRFMCGLAANPAPSDVWALVADDLLGDWRKWWADARI